MEEREGDDIAIGRRQRLLVAGHKSLHCIGPLVETTTLDKALHVRIGNIGVMPRIHVGWRWLQRSNGGGGGVEAIDLELW